MSDKFQPADAARFAAAICRFDEENSRDPNIEVLEGAPHPRELLYARWLSDWVLKLCPKASEALRLAARCQHLCRWMIPRSSYPLTRPAYLQWREALKKFHAQKAGEILREVGYPEDVIHRVQELNLKKKFPQDAESRVLEDALCLVFLERQLADLANKTDDDKVINALQKSWKKMTPAAQAEALKLKYGAKEKSLIGRAIGNKNPIQLLMIGFLSAVLFAACDTGPTRASLVNRFGTYLSPDATKELVVTRREKSLVDFKVLETSTRKQLLADYIGSDAMRWFLCWDNGSKLWGYGSDLGYFKVFEFNSDGTVKQLAVDETTPIPRTVWESLPESLKQRYKAEQLDAL